MKKIKVVIFFSLQSWFSERHADEYDTRDQYF